MTASKNSASPFLSVLIPTRERGEYLDHALDTCLAVSGADVEVVVSDNASTDGTDQIVAVKKDPRLRYVNTGRRVSMRENFETAVSNASGRYLLMIGDDDAVLSSGFETLRSILESEQPDLVHWTPPSFEWPSSAVEPRGGYTMVKYGVVYGEPRNTATPSLRDAIYAGTIRNYRDCPGIYHGCVSRRHLDRLQARAGRVFASHVPDVYLCFASAMLADSFVHIDHPITIGGISPKSTGVAGNTQAMTMAQERVLQTFKQETAIEGETDFVDVGLRSLSAHQLACLVTVDRLFGDGSRSIGWERWVRRALAEFARLSPEERARSLKIFNRNLASVGQEGLLDRLLAEHGEPRPKRSRHRLRVANPGRIRLSYGREATVRDAARELDAILGTHRPFAAGGVVKRTFRWLGLLARLSVRRGRRSIQPTAYR